MFPLSKLLSALIQVGALTVTDAEGAIAVLDVADGAVAGLDVVVWPEVTSSRSLALPSGVESGRVVLRGPRADRTTSVEIEAVLTIRTNPGESIYHLKLGGLPAARAIRVADQLGETPPPTPEELRLIREELDPGGAYTR